MNYKFRLALMGLVTSITVACSDEQESTPSIETNVPLKLQNAKPAPVDLHSSTLQTR